MIAWLKTCRAMWVQEKLLVLDPSQSLNPSQSLDPSQGLNPSQDSNPDQSRDRSFHWAKTPQRTSYPAPVRPAQSSLPGSGLNFRAAKSRFSNGRLRTPVQAKLSTLRY